MKINVWPPYFSKMVSLYESVAFKLYFSSFHSISLPRRTNYEFSKEEGVAGTSECVRPAGQDNWDRQRGASFKASSCEEVVGLFENEQSAGSWPRDSGSHQTRPWSLSLGRRRSSASPCLST